MRVFLVIGLILALSGLLPAPATPAAPAAQPALGWTEYDFVDQRAPLPAVSFPEDGVPWLGIAGAVHATYLTGPSTIKVDLTSPGCPTRAPACWPATVQYRHTGQGNVALLLWSGSTNPVPALGTQGQPIPWDVGHNILTLYLPAPGCGAGPP